MNSKSGAIPKKSKFIKIIRFSSSDSEGDIDGNKPQVLNISKDMKNRTSNFKKSSRLQLDDYSLHMNEGAFAHGNANSNSTSDTKIIKRGAPMNSQFEQSEYDIDISDSEEMAMVELNEMMKKYGKENIYAQRNDNNVNISQSAAEVGRAAMIVAQTKSKNVDLTHRASNQLKKYIFERQKTTTSAPKVTVNSKPLFKKSKIVKTSVVVSKIPQIKTKRDENKRENRIVDNRLRTATASSRVSTKPNAVAQSAKLRVNSKSNKRVINQTSTSLSGHNAPANKKVIQTTTTRLIKSVSSRNAVKKPNTKLLEIINEEPQISSSTSKISDRKSLNLFPECPVCFEQLLLHKQTVATSCGHLYCRECIDAIKARSNVCPMCRVVITQVIELHV